MIDIEIKKYKEYRKGTLLGFVDILFNPIGLEIRGISWFRKDDGSEWFSMPSEKFTNELGEEKFRAHCGFPDKRIYDRFQELMREKMALHVRMEPSNNEELSSVPF